MKIYLFYGYEPTTTGSYFEKSFNEDHEVYYVGPPYLDRAGYYVNQDVELLYKSSHFPKPDLLLFVDSGLACFPRGMEKLACPTACYLIDLHQAFWMRKRYAVCFDYIFVAQKTYVEILRKEGFRNVFWLPLACDQYYHGKQDLPSIYDIGFVGRPKAGALRERHLTMLNRYFKLNDYMRFYAKEEIGKIYSQSKIIFNCSVAGDLNMRVFEALASGTMLVTDYISQGLLDLFKDGTHLITYIDKDDLMEKVRYYLQNASERELIAAQGMQEVLSHHTYKHRADEMVNKIFSSKHTMRCAPIRFMKSGKRHGSYARIYSMLRLIDPVCEEFYLACRQRKGIFYTGCILIQVIIRKLSSVLQNALILK